MYRGVTRFALPTFMIEFKISIIFQALVVFLSSSSSSSSALAIMVLNNEYIPGRYDSCMCNDDTATSVESLF